MRWECKQEEHGGHAGARHEARAAAWISERFDSGRWLAWVAECDAGLRGHAFLVERAPEPCEDAGLWAMRHVPKGTGAARAGEGTTGLSFGRPRLRAPPAPIRRARPGAQRQLSAEPICRVKAPGSASNPRGLARNAQAPNSFR